MRLIASALASLLALSGIAAAQDAEEATAPFVWSFEATLVSDYLARGVSETQGKPAWQVGALLSHESGAYAGAWASRVSYEGDTETHVELDLYAGYAFAWDDTSLDIAAITYFYPAAGEARFDYAELSAILAQTVGDVQVSATLIASPEGSADSGTYLSLGGDIAWSLSEQLTLSAGLGYQWFEDNEAYGLPDYADAALVASYTVESATLLLGLSWAGLDASECAEICDTTAWAGLSIGL